MRTLLCSKDCKKNCNRLRYSIALKNHEKYVVVRSFSGQKVASIFYPLSPVCTKKVVFQQCTMRPENITQLIRKQVFSVTDVRAIGKLILRKLLCVFGAHITYVESPALRKTIPARTPCVTDLLCDWEISAPKQKKVRVIVLGPIVCFF